ncbi:unnamed protein product [Schistosoma spindalis]|nr:unnamed protein product [Schistosoma spindale]
MGRRKIEVQKIEDKNKCVATFRKRRDGLFKKALELHRLTGAEITLSLVYNKSRYYFSSHGDMDDGDVINNFHYTKHFQFKKQSIISPCYNSSGSWTMLSPSSIIPSCEVSSSHLVDQSEKVFNDENILSIVQTHTNSPLLESNYQSLQFIYSPNNLSYSSSINTTTDQQLSKEFNSSPLSQILEFIDENVSTTTTTTPPALTTNTTDNISHNNDESEVDNNNNKKQYLDLDNNTSQLSYFTELQTPNIICYLDEPINYYSIDNPVD